MTTVNRLENIALLESISALVPSQGITPPVFARLYPDATDGQEAFDLVIYQLLTWYRSSIENAIKEKEAVSREKEAAMSGKENLIKEKENTMAMMKDVMQKRDQEAADVVTVLMDVATRGTRSSSKWGTVTRAQNWRQLVEDERVHNKSGVLGPINAETKAKLAAKFDEIDTTKWQEEKHMYPDILNAIQSSLYVTSDLVIADTSSKGYFHADLSVSEYADERLLFCLRYFIELKRGHDSLLSPENCGQMLEYLIQVRAKQPSRNEFVGILSNFDSAHVFVVSNSTQDLQVDLLPARSLADAVVYADELSKSQYTAKIGPLNSIFLPNFSFLDVGQLHTVLSVEKPVNRAQSGPHTNTVQTRSTTMADAAGWRSPRRHSGGNRFVLKVARGNAKLFNEINFLKKFQNEDCIHLPELVWSPRGGKELGIVPLCSPIVFGESPPLISRRIITGLLDGLQHLHRLNIVHRDIRPSNLVLDNLSNVVIIDYETAIEAGAKNVEYLGGHICWPKRMLESNTDRYKPEPVDDLHATILVVLHLIFPSHFDRIYARYVKVSKEELRRTQETQQLLDLWKAIENSTIWSRFVKAADGLQYGTLKGMADVFCHL